MKRLILGVGLAVAAAFSFHQVARACQQEKTSQLSCTINGGAVSLTTCKCADNYQIGVFGCFADRVDWFDPNFAPEGCWPKACQSKGSCEMAWES